MEGEILVKKFKKYSKVNIGTVDLVRIIFMMLDYRVISLIQSIFDSGVSHEYFHVRSEIISTSWSLFLESQNEEF